MKIRKRSRLPKHLRLRSNGVYYLDKMVSGKRVVKSLETRDLNEAMQVAAQVLDEILNTNSVETLKRTVEAYLKYVARRIDAEPHTKVGYCFSAKKFLRWAIEKHGSAVKLKAVTEKVVETFFHDASKGLDGRGPLTLNSQHTLKQHLSPFFKWCIESRLMAKNPVHTIKLAKAGAKSRRAEPFCSIDQLSSLIKNAPDDDMRFILYMGFHAGCRKMEITQARRHWFQIDGDNHYLEVKRAEGKLLRAGERPFKIKSSDERSIPISKSFKAFLQTYLSSDLNPLDFILRPSIHCGKGLYRTSFARDLKAFVYSQKLPWVTPHTMRRTFASILAQEGKSIFKIAEWLGDDVKITRDKYAFLMKNDDAINVFDPSDPDADNTWKSDPGKSPEYGVILPFEQQKEA